MNTGETSRGEPPLAPEERKHPTTTSVTKTTWSSKVQAPPANTNERTNERIPGLTRGARHLTHNQRDETTQLRGNPKSANPHCLKALDYEDTKKVQTLFARTPFTTATAPAKQAGASITVEPSWFSLFFSFSSFSKGESLKSRSRLYNFSLPFAKDVDHHALYSKYVGEISSVQIPKSRKAGDHVV